MSELHTPGPWFINGHDLVEGAQGAIAGILTVNPADARLIAAAPELLEALKRVVMRCGPFSPDGKIARAAIAKATGAA